MRCLYGHFCVLAATRNLHFDAYEQSFILVRVQKTKHAYKSQGKSQVKNSLSLPANENYTRTIMTYEQLPRSNLSVRDYN
jgi:hypothetical protein